MKRRYAVLILALAGALVYHAARAQQTQPASSGGSTGLAPAAADPLKDPNCQRRFEATFGPEAVKVDMSASKVDDADFAETLAAAAAKADDDTGFQVYLYDKVCIFGLRLTRTHALVQQALAKLDSLAPRQRRCWEDYRLELCRQLQRQAKSADRMSLGEDLIVELIIVGDLRAEAGKWDEAAELYQQAVQTASSLKSRQKDAAAEKLNQANRMKEVLALRRRLEQNPSDTRLRISVIDAHLGLLDDPAGAAKLLNAEVGEVYRTYVPLAARIPGDLAPGPLMELGNWYQTLAHQGPPASRPTLVRRTKDYYLAYISKIRREGATVLAVQEAVTKINASLKEIGQDKLLDKVFFRDPAVQKSFDKAVQWLWNAQEPNGAWVVSSGYSSGYGSGYGASYYYGAYNTFSTAAALAALLGSGASVDDARAVKTIRWLEPTTTMQTDGMAFRCLAWLEIQKQKPGRAGQILANDVATLIRATRNGSYGETVTSWDYTSFSRSWQAPLGVDAGEQSGLKVQHAYWQQVAGYWASQQRADGSISPDSKGDARNGTPNTIIGAGSLAIALGRLYGPEAVKNPGGAQGEPLARALSWLDKNFTTLDDLRPEDALARKMGDTVGRQVASGESDTPKHIIFSDATYMLSRLGLAAARDKLGQVKWWTDGSRYVVGLQKSDGSWGGIVDTTLVTLFMINGYKFEQANLGALRALLAGAATRPAATRPATTQNAKPKPPALAESEARRLLRTRESTLKRHMKAQPDNRALAEQLVRLYVVELQEPPKALEYADRTGNFLVKRFIGLLGKDMSILYPGEMLGLADWHMELADGATDAGRKLTLTRAVTCYQDYLARKPAMPTDAAKARASLEEARDALSAMGGQ
jgi:hypothetical protein